MLDQGESSEQKQSEEELVESERNSTLGRQARVSAAQAGLQATLARQKQAEQKQLEEQLLDSERTSNKIREARMSAAQAGLQATLLANQGQAERDPIDCDEPVSQVSSVDPKSQGPGPLVWRMIWLETHNFFNPRESERK
jgi:septal ring factor EnvC (AmiA/AmiB activator)